MIDLEGIIRARNEQIAQLQNIISAQNITIDGLREDLGELK